MKDEDLRVVNFCQLRKKVVGLIARILTVLNKEVSANSVPAAAVRRRVQTLSGITGRKGRVGGLVSQE